MTRVRVIQSSPGKEMHIQSLHRGHTQACQIITRRIVRSSPDLMYVLTQGGHDVALPVSLRRRLWRTPLFFSEATVCFVDYRGRGLVA